MFAMVPVLKERLLEQERPFFIEHGVNGLLVAHEPHAVAAAITQILTDRPLRDRLVARARLDVQHYAVPRVAERYGRLFQEMAA